MWSLETKIFYTEEDDLFNLEQSKITGISQYNLKLYVKRLNQTEI